MGHVAVRFVADVGPIELDCLVVANRRSLLPLVNKMDLISVQHEGHIDLGEVQVLEVPVRGPWHRDSHRMVEGRPRLARELRALYAHGTERPHHELHMSVYEPRTLSGSCGVISDGYHVVLRKIVKSFYEKTVSHFMIYRKHGGSLQLVYRTEVVVRQQSGWSDVGGLQKNGGAFLVLHVQCAGTTDSA